MITCVLYNLIIYIYNKDIYVYKKSPTFMKIVGRGLVYFFMNRELNDIAIRIINIKSTIILLIKRLILSRLYRI